MIDRSHIGFTTEPSSVPIDPWRVKLFCEAIGETDSSSWQVGHVLPPTYLKAIEGEHFSSAKLMQLLRVPLRGVLHAEQSFEHFAPVHVGDTVEVQRLVTDIHDKKDGTLTFIVVDTRFAVAGRAAAVSRQTIVVRNTQAAS